MGKPLASHEQHQADAPEILSVAVLTISDTRTELSDSSGSFIRESLQQAGHLVGDYRIVKDDPSFITSELIKWSQDASIDAVVMNGGTGISARDLTFAAITELLTTVLPGFGELFRMLSYEEVGAAAMLSRASAGAIETTAIFALPGSTNAVRLGMHKLILPEIAHVVYELRK